MQGLLQNSCTTFLHIQDPNSQQVTWNQILKMILWNIYSDCVTWEIIDEISQASGIFSKTCRDHPVPDGKEKKYINVISSHFSPDMLKTELQTGSLVSSKS